MIRVELHRSHPRRWLLVAALAGATAGLGIFTFLTAREGPFPSVLHLPGRNSEEVKPLRPEPEPLRPEPEPVEAVPVPPEMPRGTTACLRILRLGSRLSPPLRLSSLAADAKGGFNLEGSCRADQVTGLESLLDTLKSLPAKATLSYRRDRNAGEYQYRFAFQGRLSGFGGIPLPPVTSAQAALLFGQVEERARAAGLRGVNADAVEEQELGDSLLRKRGKFWASGSRSQIAAFARAIGLPTQRQALVELLVVPGYSGEDADWESAQMFATVDVLVMADEQETGG